MPSRDPSASRSPSSSRPGKPSAGRGSKVRTDGKVDISCPQCGTKYRIAEESLDSKIECTECHRVFFAKTTVGKRAKVQDNTKTYVGLGIGALLVVFTFVMMSSSNDKPPAKPKPPEVRREVFSPGTHPRAQQIVKWAQAMGNDNRLVIQSHNDMAALANALGVPAGDADAVFAAIQTHESTKFLRELVCESGTLADEAAMSAPSGKAKVFVTPKPGTDDYHKNTRGVLDVSFTMVGEQVKVTGWTVELPPARIKADPSKRAFVPNKDIAASKEVEITDSAGTRKVRESEPAPVPHWDKATPEQRAKADQVVADVLRSADPEAPGSLFNKATMSVQTLDDRKAVVPRALNAMYELYSDVNGNVMKLSQLDRALRGWTGGAHNFELAGTGDAAKDKALRESCVRQWFAFWWRYSSGDLADFIDMRENLDEPLEDPKKKAAPKK